MRNKVVSEELGKEGLLDSWEHLQRLLITIVSKVGKSKLKI